MTVLQPHPLLVKTIATSPVHSQISAGCYVLFMISYVKVTAYVMWLIKHDLTACMQSVNTGKLILVECNYGSAVSMLNYCEFSAACIVPRWMICVIAHVQL